MNYCTLKEAWGQDNNTGDIYEKFNNTNNKKRKKPIKKNIIETFAEKVETYSESAAETYNCKKIINHIKKCKKCQMKLRKEFCPKLLSNVQGILNENRDLFVLVLLGICIVLFFNIIMSINKESSPIKQQYPTFRLVPSQ